jgi:hypothetical protein
MLKVAIKLAADIDYALNFQCRTMAAENVFNDG